MKKYIMLLFFLIFLKSYSSIEGEVINHKLTPEEELYIKIDINENYSGTADLKLCLANFDINTLNYNYRCDTLLERYNITFNNTFFKYYNLNMNSITPNLYRLFVQLHYLDHYKKDCDKNNFIYLIPTTTIVKEKKTGITIEEINIPNKIEQQQKLTTTIKITNYEKEENINTTIKIYNINQSLEKNNKIKISKNSNIILNQSLQLNNITTGEYTLSIKINDYIIEKQITILPKTKIKYNISIINNTLFLINKDNITFNYEIKYLNTTKNKTITGKLLPNHEKRTTINNLNTLIRIKINNKIIYEKINIQPQKTIIKTEYKNTTIIKTEKINYSKLTGDIILNISNLSKHFYMFSALIGIISLIIMYKKIK